MTRRERIEYLEEKSRGWGISITEMDELNALRKVELRALWAVEQEYSAAIERGGGTIPPALAAYRVWQGSND